MKKLSEVFPELHEYTCKIGDWIIAEWVKGENQDTENKEKHSSDIKTNPFGLTFDKDGIYTYWLGEIYLTQEHIKLFQEMLDCSAEQVMIHLDYLRRYVSPVTSISNLTIRMEFLFVKFEVEYSEEVSRQYYREKLDALRENCINNTIKNNDLFYDMPFERIVIAPSKSMVLMLSINGNGFVDAPFQPLSVTPFKE